MCLLHALKQISSNRIVAIHLNHNWRGEESDNEELNCKSFCKSENIEFYSEKLPDNIEKNETAAREERYKFFERCSIKFGSRIIFTAHNKNDNAETLLYRITKGTGITGLQGIAPVRDLYYRPLLDSERFEIEEYCKLNNLNPNIDSSNDDVIHSRNLIRKIVLPELNKINPSIISSLNRLAQNAQEDTEIVDEYLELVKNKIFKNGEYNTSKFLELSYAMKMRMLYETVYPLVPQNYDRERIEILYNFILENKDSKSGKICSVTSGYNLFVCEKYFEIISSENSQSFLLKIDKCGEYKIGNSKVIISECQSLPESFESKSNSVVYVDLSGFDFDFCLRTRQNGDLIQPFGMSGHQKLKKYLNSRKIPNHQKDNLILLTKGNEVLWVCGLGISEKVRVKKQPTHKIEVKV